MALTGLVAANNLSDIVDIEKTWDSIGSNISATVTVPSPVLDLNFASNKSLIDSASGNDLITFTRDSVGTFVDGNGILQTAASGVPRFDHNPITGESLGLLAEGASTNYLLNGNALNAWATKECSVSNDGTTILGSTAWKITANSTLSNHYVAQGDGNGGAQMFSVYVKRGNTRYAMVSSQGDVSVTGTAARPSYYAVIDFDSKTVSDVGNFQYVQLTQVESNAYRIQFASGYAGGDLGARGLSVHPLQNTGSTWYFAGNGEYVYAAMAQNEGLSAYYYLNRATSYIPTSGSTVTRAADVASIQGSNFGTSKNLIPYPENFVNGLGWSTGATTVTENVTLSPFGQLTADLLLETVASTEHIVYPDIFQGVTSAQTFSVFVKANGRDNVSLRVYIGYQNWASKIFNLSGAGSVTQSSIGPNTDFTISNQSITKYDNNWYRISITTIQPYARLMYFSIDLCTTSTAIINNDSGTENYLGDVTKGIYLWGAQRELSPIATAYSTYPPVSNWFNADTGTFFAKGFAKDTSNAGYATYFLGLGNDVNLSTNTGSSVLARYSGTNYPAIIASLNGDENGRAVGVELPSYPAAVTIAAAFQDNNSVMAGNGMLSPLIIGKALAKNVNYMRIGANRSGASCINSTISRIAFWPACLPSITLKALSSSNVVSSFTYPLSITGKDILALKEVKNTSIRDFIFIKKLTSKAQPRITVAAQYTASGVALRNAAMPKIAPVTRGNYFFSSGLTLSGVSCQINGTNARSIATSPFSGSTATVPLLFAGLRPQTNWRISETMASGVVTSPENAIPIETGDFLLFIKAGQS